jgi:hypothetical protein
MSKSTKKESKRNLEDLVNYNFVPDASQIKEKTRNKVVKLMNYYGPQNVKGFVWNANWSDNRNLDVPSGFSFAVSDSTPISHKMFSPEKMFQATSAYRIDLTNTKFSDGSLVNLKNVIQRIDKIESGLNKSNLQEKQNDTFSLKAFDSRNGSSEKLTPVMGTAGSFVGLYMSEDRSNYKPSQQFWILAQSRNTAISEELYRIMEEESREEKRRTFKEFFFDNNKEVKGILGHIKLNRKILLQNIFNNIGLEMNIKTEVSPTLETQTNKVTNIVSNKTMVYHSGTVDPSTVSGLIFNNNPHLGSTILKGQPDENEEFGKPWAASDDTFSAFPINTGRRLNESEVKNSPLKTSINVSNKVFTWDSKNDICWRLADDVYKRRDKAFKNIQASIGYDPNWGEIDLQPVMVRLSNSD